MSQDAEKIKNLVTFKKKLEAKIAELNSDLQETQDMLETINSVLLEKGFRHPEIKQQPPFQAVPPKEVTAEPPGKLENAIPLKDDAGQMLANLYLSEDTLRVMLAQDKNFDINTPPFNQFLIERVLLKMQERDNELARTGQLSSEKILRYSIVRDGDIVREIVIKNFGEERLKELRSSIRWTLEKMLEKTRS